MKYICIRLIKFYRKNISPLKQPCCRFMPTCSEYAIQAFSVHGFFKGIVLSLWRILRCNPFGKWGYDPIPTPTPESVKHNKSCECRHEDMRRTIDN